MKRAIQYSNVLQTSSSSCTLINGRTKISQNTSKWRCQILFSAKKSNTNEQIASKIRLFKANVKKHFFGSY